MTLVEHARNELEKAGLFDKDSDYGGMIGEAVMELAKKFDEQNHSGCSAALTVSLFSKLVEFEPLSPLTKDPDEWIQVDENTRQNKRCSHVFWRIGASKPYTIKDYIFTDKDGHSFISNACGQTFFDLPGFPPKVKHIKEDTIEHRQFVEEHYGLDPFERNYP